MSFDLDWIPFILYVSILIGARIWLLEPTKTGPCEKYWGVTCQCSEKDRKLMYRCPPTGKRRIL